MFRVLAIYLFTHLCAGLVLAEVIYRNTDIIQNQPRRLTRGFMYLILVFGWPAYMTRARAEGMVQLGFRVVKDTWRKLSR
jgi:hypothetical protein